MPPTWNPDTPSPEDFETPYGRLYDAIGAETNPDDPASLVSVLTQMADVLAIPRLP